METSEGGLLRNRLRYRQPVQGYRTGIEPVLLAAAVPARPGEMVLEAGAGAGAGLLCLAARVPGVVGTALELDAGMAALAGENLAANGFAACRAVVGDVAHAAAFGPVDHAFANPPWHDAAGTASPVPARNAAKRASAELPGHWVKGLVAALRGRGSLTLILPASGVPAWLATLLANGLGAPMLRPLWPREGQAAKLVLLSGVKGGRGGFRLMPGLTLHEGAGHEGAGFTAAAERILRDGQGFGPES
jgi:tRNA1Val (adenine37-N6)-methyltransferase